MKKKKEKAASHARATTAAATRTTTRTPASELPRVLGDERKGGSDEGFAPWSSIDEIPIFGGLYGTVRSR